MKPNIPRVLVWMLGFAIDLPNLQFLYNNISNFRFDRVHNAIPQSGRYTNEKIGYNLILTFTKISSDMTYYRFLICGLVILGIETAFRSD
jgi:hypothetical protein